MSKKAIVYYAGFINRAGGVITHAVNIKYQLVKIGWDANIVSLESLPFLIRYLPHIFEKIVNIVYKPFGFVVKDRITRFIYKSFYYQKVDLIVFEDIYLYWCNDSPTIVMLHAVWSDNLQSYKISPYMHNKLRKFELNIIESIPHHIATVSFPYSQYIQKEHFHRKVNRKIDVIELGRRTCRLYKSLDYSNRPLKSIVSCGILEDRKNMFFLLRLFHKMYKIDSEYTLTIIGDGVDKKKMNLYAKNNNLPVKFTGRLSNDKVMSELLKNRIYVHTSKKESFSYSLLEAKECGLVTIANSHLQVPADFIDYKVQSFEIDEWCDIILNINFDKNNFPYGKYTVENMVDSTLNLVN